MDPEAGCRMSDSYLEKSKDKRLAGLSGGQKEGGSKSGLCSPFWVRQSGLSMPIGASF